MPNSTDARLAAGLAAYIAAHASHNDGIGAERFVEVTHQAAACAQCASMYVGPRA